MFLQARKDHVNSGDTRWADLKEPLSLSLMAFSSCSLSSSNGTPIIIQKKFKLDKMLDISAVLKIPAGIDSTNS